MLKTPVLIVGGSLVGLSASLFLSWRGVSNIVIEKHLGSSPHPRAKGFTETTLEHFRAVGIADRIPQQSEGGRPKRVVVESLSSEWKDELEWTPGETPNETVHLSPCKGVAISQDKLEPILREASIELGSDLRLGVELLEFGQNAQGVMALVKDRNSGLEYYIHASFMIAADGADSAIRQKLGISQSGVGHLRFIRSVLFKCTEADQYLEKGVTQFAIEQKDFHAFLTTYGDSRWALMLEGDKDYSDEQLKAAIHKSLGNDMSFEIITTGRWEMAGRIADQYQVGCIFLVGDAAHQLPPTRGGFGANTGIDDAWNLAWKLQRVIEKKSSIQLLETYHSERQPIGWLRHQQTFSRPDYGPWINRDFKLDDLYSNEAMEFGQLIRSSAVIGADEDLPAAASVKEWVGQPGTRAPHLWISKEGKLISIFDLLNKEYVLLTANQTWIDVANALNIQKLEIGEELKFENELTFEQSFGIGAGGATLIRPDGIIAWRNPNQLSYEMAYQSLKDAFFKVSFGTIPTPTL